MTAWHVPVRLPDTPLRLFDRLADKLVFNTLSTATMARSGRVISNWMAHVEPKNKNLIDRGTRLVAEMADTDYQTACYAIRETIEEMARENVSGKVSLSPVAATIARMQIPVCRRDEPRMYQ